VSVDSRVMCPCGLTVIDFNLVSEPGQRLSKGVWCRSCIVEISPAWRSIAIIYQEASIFFHSRGIEVASAFARGFWKGFSDGTEAEMHGVSRDLLMNNVEDDGEDTAKYFAGTSRSGSLMARVSK
jgi:hypothetical protein